MGNGAHVPQRPDIGPPRVITPFPVFITVLYLALTALVMALPALVQSIGDVIDPIVSPVVRLIAMVILGVVFLLVIISSIAARTASPTVISPSNTLTQQRIQAAPAQARPAVQPPAAAKQAPPASPRTFVYPDMVEGGIYGDTYVMLQDGSTIKLRTQVVGPDLVA